MAGNAAETRHQPGEYQFQLLPNHIHHRGDSRTGMYKVSVSFSFNKVADCSEGFGQDSNRSGTKYLLLEVILVAPAVH